MRYFELTLFIYETKPVFIKAFTGFLSIQKAFAPGFILAPLKYSKFNSDLERIYSLMKYCQSYALPSIEK